MISGLTAFFAMIALDFVFGLYIRRVSEGSAFSASCWATLILLLNATVILSYTKAPINVIHAAFGAFVGTYLAIKVDQRKRV